MAKKSKLSTPTWILEGYDSKADYKKSKGMKPKPKKKPAKKKTPKKKPSNSKKTFKIRKCPQCGGDSIKVVVGEKAKGLWKCKKCGWKGKEVNSEEVSEEEFLKYLDKKNNQMGDKKK